MLIVALCESVLFPRLAPSQAVLGVVSRCREPRLDVLLGPIVTSVGGMSDPSPQPAQISSQIGPIPSASIVPSTSSGSGGHFPE